MNKKTDVEVIINNKKYVICGYESPDYMEQIAIYINKKLSVLKNEDWYNRIDTDLKNILLEVNLADDYFKAEQKVRELESDRTQSNEDLFDLKHDAVRRQTELELLHGKIEELEKKYQEAQKTIIELNAKLDAVKR